MLDVHQSVEKSLSYLASAEARKSLQRDPYWPKWDSPWWHMLLLHEMGLAKRIPATIVSELVTILQKHYLPVFPIHAEDIPSGTDPYRQIACLCAIGNIYQVLFACGVDVDQELPWMREWFLRYQLPDGGLNCDEKVYVKANPKSSIVTTLSCLEAVFFCRNKDLTDEETSFLHRGANYLLKQRLFRRISTGEVIDRNWLEVRFPRFYEYDFLRGFSFLVKWRQHSGLNVPDELVDEVEDLMSHQLTDVGIHLKRYNLFDQRSYNPQDNEEWVWGQAAEFDLMKAVSFDGALCEPLTKQWNEVKPQWAIVTEAYTTVYKNPIRLNTGEMVRIEKRDTTLEWRGWVYCIDQRGVAGWVSENYLKESGPTAVVLKDYDATELDVVSGEEVKIYYEEFGWYWVKNCKGAKGWVPKKNICI